MLHTRRAVCHRVTHLRQVAAAGRHARGLGRVEIQAALPTAAVLGPIAAERRLPGGARVTRHAGSAGLWEQRHAADLARCAGRAASIEATVDFAGRAAATAGSAGPAGPARPTGAPEAARAPASAPAAEAARAPCAARAAGASHPN